MCIKIIILFFINKLLSIFDILQKLVNQGWIDYCGIVVHLDRVKDFYDKIKVGKNLIIVYLHSTDIPLRVFYLLFFDCCKIYHSLSCLLIQEQ